MELTYERVVPKWEKYCNGHESYIDFVHFFLALFSLDVFESGMSAGKIMLGLLMHNIPSIIMAVLLVIAWKKEIVGAVGYFGAGLLYNGIVIFNIVNSGLQWYLAISWSLIIAGPLFIIGILFLINWKKRNEMH